MHRQYCTVLVSLDQSATRQMFRAGTLPKTWAPRLRPGPRTTILSLRITTDEGRRTPCLSKCLTLWRPPLPYWYSYKASCVSGRHGWANFCQIDETSVIYWQRPVWRATPSNKTSNKIRRESVLIFWPVRMERSPCGHPRRNLHSYLQEEIENFLFLPGVWLHDIVFMWQL